MRAFIILAIACFAPIAVATSDEKNVVCYFRAWSSNHPRHRQLAIENIDANLCTHLVYAFVGINDCDVEVKVPRTDLSERHGEAGFQRFNALRKSNTKLKNLLAIGGWKEDSEKFSHMALDPKCRTQFIQNAIEFVEKHKFDGFDLNWIYPAQNGGSDADVENFVALIKEMSRASDAQKLILSATVGATKSTASTSYDIPTLSKYLDFVNLMTYELHGYLETQTGFHAALYGTDINDALSVNYIVNDWLRNGLDPRKLNLGIPFYGITFSLAASTVNGINAPTIGPGKAGRYTEEKGFLSYNDICEMQHEKKLAVKYDEKSHAYFGYHGDQWVSFDNVESIMEKAEYIKKTELGGAMIWAINDDNFNGECGEKWPLLKAINRVLRNRVDLPEISTHGPMTTPPTVIPPPMDVTMEPEIPTVPIGTSHGPAVTSDPEMTMVSHDEPNQICKKMTKTGNSVDPKGDGFYQCTRQPDGTFKTTYQPCGAGLRFSFEKDACDWK